MEILRESRTIAKRETILAASTAAFRDEGYESTSMDRIAELAGASKRTVYNHFGSKEALFQAVVARLFEESMALNQVEWDPNRSLEEQLGDFVRAKTLLSEDRSARCLTRVVLGVYIKQPDLLREVIARVAEDESILANWLREAHQAGQLSVPDPELAAHMFGKMTAGVLFWPQLLEGQMDSDTRERLTRELVQTFLARYRLASG
ncbi:MAG: TetR/AcrR family transcriptional regulator [Myxococcales bacterium]|nr:TetR/AcrR family transcriptional regulator [Myxococcales bacterium]